jgi:hypothetical protein
MFWSGFLLLRAESRIGCWGFPLSGRLHVVVILILFARASSNGETSAGILKDVE